MFSFTGPMPIYFTDRDMEKIIQTIKEQYPKPSCQRENGCIYSQAMEYKCIKCIQWKVSQEIIKIIKEYK